MSTPNDLKFLTEISHTFFKQPHIRRTLIAILEDGITGWEKWLQIELATYFRQHKSIKKWGREVQHKLDLRTKTNKKTCAVDFIIQQKHKHSNLALEIKQSRSMTSCIQGMLRDLLKVNKIKNSHFESRGIWCLGIHPADEFNSILNEIQYYAKKRGLILNEKCIASDKIGKTGFSYTIF